MPAATSHPVEWCYDLDQHVFVLELDGLPTLAFGAAGISNADEISRSTWFRRAFDRFRSGRPVTGSNTHLRPATDKEAAAFNDLADEFAEPTQHFLVAHLAGRDDR